MHYNHRSMLLRIRWVVTTTRPRPRVYEVVDTQLWGIPFLEIYVLPLSRGQWPLRLDRGWRGNALLGVYRQRRGGM